MDAEAAAWFAEYERVWASRCIEYRAKHPDKFEYDRILAQMPKPIRGVAWTPEQERVWAECQARLQRYYEAHVLNNLQDHDR